MGKKKEKSGRQVVRPDEQAVCLLVLRLEGCERPVDTPRPHTVSAGATRPHPDLGHRASHLNE